MVVDVLYGENDLIAHTSYGSEPFEVKPNELKIPSKPPYLFVTVEAIPKSGSAPLEVKFRARATMCCKNTYKGLKLHCVVRMLDHGHGLQEYL